MVMGTTRFEQWLWDQCVSEVKHYHGDNGIFSAEEYHRDCDEKGLSQSFSGVGAQTKMHVLSKPSKQSCTWHGPLWSMPPCIGQIVDLMIYLSGLLKYL
jgi:hypothetical protein